MRQRGLPEGYAAALETGLWPSCDILPTTELATRGRWLDPAAVFWRDRATLRESDSAANRDNPGFLAIVTLETGSSLNLVIDPCIYCYP
jgi:hypothetical protein